jgi:hypothetical protein
MTNDSTILKHATHVILGANLGAAPMWLERILSGLDAPREPDAGSRLLAFQRVVALVVATEYWTKTIRDRALFETADGVALALVSVLAAAILLGRFRRAAFAGLALVQAWWIWRFFPLAGNHRYLELILAIVFSALDERSGEHRRLQLRAVRFMVIVVLFYSGLQKLVWGYWSHGQFLAFAVDREPFTTMLGWLVPTGELARLTSYSGAIGDGPYLIGAPSLIAVSNLVWIVEIGLALLLWHPATRRWGWPFACLLVVSIELVARELMFGVEFCAAIALFARGDRLTRWVVPIAMFLGLLVLVRLGLLPEVVFH